MNTSTPAPGSVAHFAINADDVERGCAFYAAAFGWTFRPWGPPGFFQIANDSAKPGILGAMQSRRQLVNGQRTVGFECTIAVADVQVACRAIVAAGGTIVMGPVSIPTVGELAFFQDTEGNVAGVMEYASF